MTEDFSKMPLGLLVMALRGALHYKSKAEQFPYICEFKKRYRNIDLKKFSNKRSKNSIIPASSREIQKLYLDIGKLSIINAGYDF